MNWIELLATLLGIAYVLLMIRRNILCWVAGNISVALQAISFYNVHLYADMTLQAVYFAMGCYGLWLWRKRPRRDSDERQIKRIESFRKCVPLGCAWVCGSIVWAAVLRGWTNAALPELDATLATASLVATWMQAHRYLENWLLWIAIDVAYAGVYWNRGLLLYVVLYAVFALMALQGWKVWRRMLQ